MRLCARNDGSRLMRFVLRPTLLVLAAASAAALAYDAGRRRERARVARFLVERDRRLGIRPAAVRTALASGADAMAIMDAIVPKAHAVDLTSLAKAVRPAPPVALSSLPDDPYIRRLALERQRRQIQREARAIGGDVVADINPSTSASAEASEGCVAAELSPEAVQPDRRGVASVPTSDADAGTPVGSALVGLWARFTSAAASAARARGFSEEPAFRGTREPCEHHLPGCRDRTPDPEPHQGQPGRRAR